LFGVWRNLSVLVDTRGDRRTFGITIGHGADNIGSAACSTPARPIRTAPYLVSEHTNFGPFS
jgi:hypothetical protein